MELSQSLRRATRGWILVAVAAGACNTPPEAPSITISPADPKTGDDLTAEVVSVVDANEDEVTFTYRWYRDGTEVTDVTGATVPAASTAKGELWTVEVTPNDGKDDGAVGSASVTIGNTAPEGAVTVAPTAPTSVDDLTATATGTDADGDEVTWSYVWTKDGQATGVTTATVPGDQTERGEVWEVTATPSDGEDDGASVTAQVSIDNGPPAIASVTLGPEPANAHVDLVATVDVTDPDGDAVTLSFEWTLNGSVVAGNSSDTLPASQLTRGDMVSVVVTPTDGMLTGATATDDVEIVNAIPTVTGVVLSPTPVREATVATCAPQGWFDGDGDPESYVYTWTVNGTLLTGETEATLDGASFDKGDTVACTATPDDGLELGAVTSSPTETVANSAPVLSSAALSSDAPATTDTLSVVLGSATDDDGDPITYEYAWYVQGVLVSTESTLAPTFFEKDDQVYCEVTPTDSFDDGPVVTTPTVVVGNTAPTVVSATFSPDPVRTLDDLTAVPVGADADGDSVSFHFAWTVDGVPAGGDSATLSSAAFVRGDEVVVTITPTDGFASGAPFVLGPTRVRDTVPTITGVAVAPEMVYEATTARCEPEGWFDPDGDPEDYDFLWTVNGGVVFGETSSQLTGAFFDKGDVLVCTATPKDQAQVGTESVSAPVQVLNSPAVLDAAFVQPATPIEGDLLTAQLVNLRDDDPSDTAVALYEWVVDGIPVSTDATLDSSLFARGDVIFVRVTPWDDVEYGTVVVSPGVVVGNAAPFIRGIAVTPSPTLTETDAVAVVDGVDPDDDPLTYTYQWYLNGNPVPGATTDTLPETWFERDDVIWVEAVAMDDALTSAPFTSSPVTIANSPPSQPVVRVAPAFGMAGVDDLVCELVEAAVDPDGDNVTYEFTWTRDGQPFGLTGFTFRPGDTIPGAETGVGEVWTCSAVGVDSRDDASEPGVAEARSLELDLRRGGAGDGFTCALDTTNHVRCWGSGASGIGAYPATEVEQIGANFNSACARGTDDGLVCWGSDAGINAPPPGTFGHFAVGISHACAIGTNGIPDCWGSNILGESSAPVRILTDITAGFFHSCGVDETGAAVCWGDDTFAQGTEPTGVFRDVAAGWFFTCWLDRDGAVSCYGDLAEAPPAGPFVSIAAGSVHACGVRPDGTGACWGDGVTVDLSVPAGTWAELWPGVTHTCGLGADGVTRCWGDSARGEIQPSNLALDAIVAGGAHTCGVDAAGDVLCWGDDASGQATVPALPGQAIAVDLGNTHTCAIAGALELVCWGDDTFGKATPPPGELWTSVAAGYDHTCGITASGDLACFGDDSWGQSSAPTTGGPWQAIGAAQEYSCGIDANDEIVCWGTNLSDALLSPAGAFVDLGVGLDHNCAIDTAGALDCWGNNAFGKSTPPGGTSWVDVVSGAEHSCALDDAGAVTCWGNAAESRLDVPPGVFSELNAGEHHTCAVRDDGATLCWGRYLY